MSSAKSIIQKVSAVLKKVGPPVRLVYLRTSTTTGANQLTGYPGVTTNTNTLLVPQPYYTRLGRQRIPGQHTRSEDAVNDLGGTDVLDDWIFYVSPDALKTSQVQDTNFRLVLKIVGLPALFGSIPFGSGTESGSARDEVFRMLDDDPAMIYGENVILQLYMRSIKRT